MGLNEHHLKAKNKKGGRGVCVRGTIRSVRGCEIVGLKVPTIRYGGDAEPTDDKMVVILV